MPDSLLGQIQDPKQKRSRRTMESILGATEELLESRGFEQLTLGEILERAGCSVGAFYGRFQSKDALLPFLYERYDRQIDAELDASLAPEQWTGQNLQSRIKYVIDESIRRYRERRGLLRAVALHARNHPEELESAVFRRRARQYRKIREILLERREEMNHPDPEQATDLGLLAVLATCREKCLFGDAPHPRSVKSNERVLSRELQRMLLAYLGAN